MVYIMRHIIFYFTILRPTHYTHTPELLATGGKLATGTPRTFFPVIAWRPRSYTGEIFCYGQATNSFYLKKKLLRKTLNARKESQIKLKNDSLYTGEIEKKTQECIVGSTVNGYLLGCDCRIRIYVVGFDLPCMDEVEFQGIVEILMLIQVVFLVFCTQ